MRRHLLFFALLCCLLPLQAQGPAAALLPYPHTVTIDKGKPFAVNAKTGISIAHTSLSFAADNLQKALLKYFGREVAIEPAGNIALSLDPSLGDEHYLLTVNSRGIALKGGSEKAVLYAVMTLEQVMLGDPASTLSGRIAALTIDDSPRYPFRALMLDPARHFLSVEEVKLFLDQMVKFKYNVLQLHLTDDQGWRIEIKCYPALTDSSRTGGYYTQAQMKEIIAYAAQRGIDILPEVDVPGHTLALLKAFPDLVCDFDGASHNGVGNSMVCAASPKTYEVIGNIIDEVASLFPYPYLHLGGDEAVLEKNWKLCSRCSNLQKEQGYSKTPQFMGYFFEKVLARVRQDGKRPILWCELNNIRMPADDYLFPYPKDVTLVTWRNGLTPKCNELTAKSGNRLIMAPGEYCYFDYPQYRNDLPEYNNWGMPTTTLTQCYRLDPSYGLSPQKDRHIQGVMGTLWGEAINDVNRACYMAFPRALALAEAGWSLMEQRTWSSFVERMYPNLDALARDGISYRVPFEIIERKQ